MKQGLSEHRWSLQRLKTLILGVFRRERRRNRPRSQRLLLEPLEERTLLTLETSSVFVGNFGAEVAAFAVPGGTSGSGTLSLHTLPSDAHVVQATLYAEDESAIDQPAATFNGVPVGTTGPFVIDGNATAYKWDVTQLVNGNGSYSVAANGFAGGYLKGIALVVVFVAPDLAERQVIINDGMDQVFPYWGPPNSASTSFAGINAQSDDGALWLFFTGDNPPPWSGEEIRFNGELIGGPIDANLGVYASLFEFPVAPRVGVSTAEIYSPNDWIGWNLAVLNAAHALLSTGDSLFRSADPQQSFVLPIAEAAIDLNTGAVRLTHDLDFDRSPGTGVGLGPQLIYNSATIDVRPIVQANYQSNSPSFAPNQIVAQLTWNGVTQAPIAFNTSGHQPSDNFLMAVQSTTPVTASGNYTYVLDLTAVMPDGSTDVRSVTGTARVVARGDSAIGVGWGIANLDRLVPTPDGVLWEYGAGDSRFFAANGFGSYTSPTNDFGTLWRNADDSFTYVAKDQTRWEFSAAGLCMSITDTHGLAQTFIYDGQGRLIQVVAIDGGVTVLAYGADGKLVTITEPGNRVFTLCHDSAGNLTTILDVDASVRNLAYDAQHHVVQDQWSPLTTGFSYDSVNGRLTGVDRGLGSVYVISPAATRGLPGTPVLTGAIGDVVATVTDGLNHTTAYLLDGENRLVRQTRPDGTKATWRRDTHGQVAKASDYLGLQTRYTYDYSPQRKGDLIRVDYPDHGFDIYAYEPTFHHVVEQTNALGGHWTFTYDPATGDLLQSTDPMGGTVTQTWSNGLLMTLADAVGTTEFGYDAARRLVSIDDDNDFDTIMTHDAAGNVATTLDPNGGLTITQFDGKNRLVLETNPAGDTFQIDYNALGDVVGTTDARGLLTVHAFDSRGFEVLQIEGANTAWPQFEEYVYDVAGNHLRTIDPVGLITRWQYDVNDGLVNEAHLAPDGVTLLDQSAFGLNANGNVTQTTDPVGNISRYTRDAVGRVVTEEVFAPNGTTLIARTRYSYDLDGNLTQIIDPNGNITRRFYDLDNRFVRESQFAPDGQTLLAETRYVYDLDDNLIDTVDANGNITHHDYDPDGRVWRVAHFEPDSVTLVDESFYFYDPDGNCVEFVDPNGNTTRKTYDGDGRLTSESHFAPDGVTLIDRTFFTPDLDGNVTEIVDPNGNITLNTYDLFDRLVTVEHYAPDGVTLLSSLETVYDADDRIFEQIDANGNVTRFWYDQAGRVEREEHFAPDGTTLIAINQMAYDAAGRLIRKIDGNFNVTAFGYDPLNRLTDTWHYAPDGVTLIAHLRRVFDPNGNIVEETDANGNITRNQFDALNRLVHEAHYAPDGVTLLSTKQSIYDPNGNLIDSIDPDGFVTRRTYDARGRVIREARFSPGGTLQISRVDYTLDDNGNVIEIRDTIGNITRKQYDARNRLIVVEHYNSTGLELQARDEYYYDPNGNLFRSIDPKGNITVDAFDALNRRVRTDHLTPDGLTLMARVDTVFDPNGNVVQETNPIGLITQFTIDALDRVVNERHFAADGVTLISQISTTFDDNGNVLEIVDPLGNWTIRTFDALDRMLTEAHYPPTGNTVLALTQYELDPNGNVVEVVDPEGRITHNTFDGLGRLVAAANYAADGVTLIAQSFRAYDPAGNVIQEIDANGNVTLTEYDFAGRRGSVTVGYGTPAAATTAFGYDGNDNLHMIFDAAFNATYYYHDWAGRVVAIYDSLFGNVTTRHYDPAGNLTEETNRNGARRTMLYDALNRLITETSYASDGLTVVDVKNFTYNAAGNILTASNSAGVYTMTYDLAGRLLTQTDPNGLTLTFSYYADGRVSSVQDSFGGVVESSFDAVNRLSSRVFRAHPGDSVSHWVYLTYNQAGQLRFITRQNQGPVNGWFHVRSELTYDSGGRLDEIKHLNHQDAVIADYLYDHDPGGRLTSATENGQGRAYGYDATNQLLTAGTDAYSFDANGNRTMPGYETGEQNKLLTDGAWNYEYDLEGNILYKTNAATGEHWSYSYDNANHMTVAEFFDANFNRLLLVEFRYDVFGNRVAKIVTSGTSAPVTTRYAYQGPDVWAELDAGNNLVMRYLRGDQPNQLLARIDAADALTWYLTDQLGSVRGFAGLVGNVYNHLDYDAFGQLINETAPGQGGTFRYAGYQWDPEIGLYYIKARYYDPAIGRFVSQDPLGLGPDSNPYRYVGNGPTNATDPTGLEVFINDWSGNRSASAHLLTQRAQSELAKVKIKTQVGAGIYSDGGTSGVLMFDDATLGAFQQLGQRTAKHDDDFLNLLIYYAGSTEHHAVVGVGNGALVVHSYTPSSQQLTNLNAIAVAMGRRAGYRENARAKAVDIIGVPVEGSAELGLAVRDIGVGTYDLFAGNPIQHVGALGRGLQQAKAQGKLNEATARGILGSVSLGATEIWYAQLYGQQTGDYSGLRKAATGTTLASAAMLPGAFKARVPLEREPNFAGPTRPQSAPITTTGNALALPEGYIGPERQLPYRGRILGGSYRDVRATNVGGDVHHMPAQSAYRGTVLSPQEGPAIHMPTLEHARTASFGGNSGFRQHIARQRQLIQQGRFMDAVQMDINDIQGLFGNRYNAHIQQMLEWIRLSRIVPGS